MMERSIFSVWRNITKGLQSHWIGCAWLYPPKDVFVEGLITLVETDKAWIPRKAGEALYLRPFMYASEARFGIKVSDEYRFIVFTGPVPELYASPIKVKVETQYIRAARGGTGFAKCGGNYGAAFFTYNGSEKKRL